MSVLVATCVLFGLMLVFLALGLPIALALGGSAVIFGIATTGMDSLFFMVSSTLNNIRTIILIAVPLFIFMGNVLQVSGVAEDLYATAHKWIGGLNGGLAIGTIIICTLFAACTGISGAATVTMGLIALPAMLSRKYDKNMAIGSVMGGGALGILIPPSVGMILFGFMASESVGRLFAGGIIPGLILSGLFIAYILVRCIMKPELGPPVPPTERASWKEKLVSLRGVILPIFLVIAVLGSIFSGFATPTEAAALGAAGALLCAVINRRFALASLKEALYKSISLTAMVMWIVVGATAFTCVFASAGGSGLIQETLVGLEVSPLFIVILMQLTLFILGMFMDPTGILLLCTPIYVPVVRALGFSVVWFGVLFIINMEMAYLTPPFGYNLFYMRGIVPKEITMGDIYRSAIPFIIIQAIALALSLLIPALIVWLPNLMFGAEL